jgi:putative MATE family efflux protein
MALPMLLGITTMMAQSFIDAWFLGRVGDRALAAYSFGFPILMIVTSVAIGLGAGTSSVVARAIGAEDHRRAKRLVTDSLILSFLITAIISVVGVLTINPLFRLLGAPDDMIPMIRTFMIILYSGVPFFVVGMVGTSGMRATGDTRLPSKIMISGAILNVILDPIFIFGVGPVPAMGLNGAATAAILARGSIFVGTLYLLQHRLDMVSFRKPELQELKRSWADILHVGLPAAGTNAIIPVGLAVITAMIARFGPEAVAGFGVASRIESLVLVLYYALSAVIGPFVGQNLSAGKEDRIQLSLRLCARFCIASGLVIAVLLALFSESDVLVDRAGQLRCLRHRHGRECGFQWPRQSDARRGNQRDSDCRPLCSPGDYWHAPLRHKRNLSGIRCGEYRLGNDRLLLGEIECSPAESALDESVAGLNLPCLEDRAMALLPRVTHAGIVLF